MDEASWNALRGAAGRARTRAHAPYSGFRVGAALLGSDGGVYAGCNVENASYGLSVCAERHAAAALVLAAGGAPQALLVLTAAARPTTPCGACRQVLAEISPGELPVRCVTESGASLDTSLACLLPQRFDGGSLA